MYFRPTVRAQQLLSDWHGMCMELNQNNQGAFNRVFGGAGQHRQLDYYIMPKALYPHGALIELVRPASMSFCAAHRIHIASHLSLVMMTCLNSLS